MDGNRNGKETSTEEKVKPKPQAQIDRWNAEFDAIDEAYNRSISAARAAFFVATENAEADRVLARKEHFEKYRSLNEECAALKGASE